MEEDTIVTVKNRLKMLDAVYDSEQGLSWCWVDYRRRSRGSRKGNEQIWKVWSGYDVWLRRYNDNRVDMLDAVDDGAETGLNDDQAAERQQPGVCETITQGTEL